MTSKSQPRFVRVHSVHPNDVEKETKSLTTLCGANDEVVIELQKNMFEDTVDITAKYFKKTN